MYILSEIAIDLQRPGAPKVIHAMQGDAHTRGVKIRLYNGGTPWTIHDDIIKSYVSYVKPDKHGGTYDKLEDGFTQAVVLQGSYLIAYFAQQVLTCPGLVQCEIKMCGTGGSVIKTFAFGIHVEASAENKIASEDYGDVPTVEDIMGEIGDLSKLTTESRSSLVAAVNELAARSAVRKVNGAGPDAGGNVELTSDAIMMDNGEAGWGGYSLTEAADELYNTVFAFRALIPSEDTINGMIDAKLAALPLAEEVTFGG